MHDADSTVVPSGTVGRCELALLTMSGAGVAVAGSGIGTFVFAPLTEWLLSTFLWRGALVVCSALLLNIVVCGAIFRPLNANTQQRRRRLSSVPSDLHSMAAAGAAGAGAGSSSAAPGLGQARSSEADMTTLSSGRLVPIHRSRVAGTPLNQSAASIVSLYSSLSSNFTRIV